MFHKRCNVGATENYAIAKQCDWWGSKCAKEKWNQMFKTNLQVKKKQFSFLNNPSSTSKKSKTCLAKQTLKRLTCPFSTSADMFWRNIIMISLARSSVDENIWPAGASKPMSTQAGEKNGTKHVTMSASSQAWPFGASPQSCLRFLPSFAKCRGREEQIVLKSCILTCCRVTSKISRTNKHLLHSAYPNTAHTTGTN